MAWNKRQIGQHKKAAHLLQLISSKTVKYIKSNPALTEFETKHYIIGLYKHFNLKSDRFSPIVAFGDSTSFVHYYPDKNSKKLKPENLIMLDLWAALNEKGAPFADITQMYYYGKTMPREFAQKFDIIIQARNRAIKYIKANLRKKNLPKGREIDRVTRDLITGYGYEKKFMHSTGHPLGFTNAHGRGVRLSPRGKSSIRMNMGYTIEPGIYFDKHFGVRSEIDFLVEPDYKFKLTSRLQNKIIKI